MSDDNVTSLGAARALKASDNRLWSPVECLEDCIRDIQSGVSPTEKLLVLRLDTKKGETFNVGYNAAGLKGSEILAMLECAKATILQEMGYVA